MANHPSGAEQVVLRRRLKIYAFVMLALWLAVFALPDFSVFPARSAFMLQLHMVVELFAVSVAAMVAALAASSLDRDRTGQAAFLATGFGSVAILDGIHALSSEGMPGALVTADTDHALYYWLLGRGVTAVTLLAVAMNLEWRRPARHLILGCALLLILSLWFGEGHPEWLPALFLPDQGVTLLKTSLEVGLALAFLYAGALLFHRHDASNYRRNLPLAAACLTLAMGEALLAEFLAPTSLANMVGHALKLVAYGFIYSAIFLDGIRAPMRKLEEANAALRESEARLRALADNLPDGLIYQFTRDADGRPRFLHMSRAVETMHQVSAEDAMRDGLPLFKQILAEDLPVMLASEAESRRTMQSSSGLIRFRRPDGQIRTMLFSSKPRIGEDGQVVWDGLEMDVTRHERTREALELERARLRGIIDSAMDGILSLDSEHRIVLMNRAAERIFGHRTDALLGQPVNLLIPERFRESHRRHLDAFGLDGASARQMGTFGHVVGLRADGTEVPLEASIARLTSDGQSLYLAIVRDVSAKIEADSARLRLEQQLQQAQKMEAVGTLAGGIAHDFNNILAIINGNVTLALEDLSPGHPAVVSLREVERAGLRGRDLVQRILTFSRSRQEHPQVLDVAALLADAKLLLRPTLPAGIELDVEVAPELPAVHMDRVALEQILVNLCSNAAQAMPHNVGRISIAVRPSRPSDATLPPDVVIEVSDTGSGISASILPRIFEPFFTTKAPGEGTGLGLPMVHGLVKRAGGHIEVRSEVGEGSVFTITLPGCAATMPPLPVNNRPSARPQHATLLYVDDEESLVFLMRRGLSRMGYTVHGFADPVEAASAVESTAVDYDVAIVDYNMPHLSGLDLARRLLARHPERGVILTSGFVDSELEDAARAIGILAVIYKPATIEDMVQVIDNWVSRSTRPESASGTTRPIRDA